MSKKKNKKSLESVAEKLNKKLYERNFASCRENSVHCRNGSRAQASGQSSYLKVEMQQERVVASGLSPRG